MAILISYRNEDSPMLSNQLYTALAQRMGARNFIFGVNNVIEPGDIVADAIKQGVQHCDLLMVFIGQNWASSGWSKNNNDPDVMAITIAQSSGKRIIPVYLMDGFQLDRNALAPSVASLLDRAPFVCKSEDDVVRLTQTLQKFINPNSAVVASGGAKPSSTSNKPVGFDAPVEAKPMFGVQAAAKVDEFNIEQNAVTARIAIHGTTQSLYMMPFYQSDVRTLIPNGAHVILLARDNNTQWLNVVYISTTGQPIAGWIPIGAVTHIAYMNMPVQVMDLPISNFEYNTFEEVKKTRKHIHQLRKNVELRYMGYAMLIFVILGGIFGAVNTSLGQSESYNSRTRSFEPVYRDTGERILLGGFGGLVVGWLSYSILVLFSPKYQELSKEIVRMKAIQQSKKGAGTLGLETLAKVGMAAAGVAGVLGAGALAMKGRAGEKERQHQQNLANKGAYGRIDIHKK